MVVNANKSDIVILLTVRAGVCDMRGREAVVAALAKEGVKHVFGIPGGHSVEIMYDALYGISDIQPILTRHEQSAAFNQSVILSRSVGDM
jgi:glyoxylate carboligase